MSGNKKYSLENKFYPLSSLESEMERLFGNPVWYEEKIKRAATKGKCELILLINELCEKI